MKCLKCGKENPDEVKYCTGCGGKMNSSELKLIFKKNTPFGDKNANVHKKNCDCNLTLLGVLLIFSFFIPFVSVIGFIFLYLLNKNIGILNESYATLPEIQEHHKHLDEQIAKTQERSKQLDEQIAETQERSKQLDEQIAETNRHAAQIIAETNRHAAQIIAESKQKANNIVLKAKELNTRLLKENDNLEQQSLELKNSLSELESSVLFKYIDTEDYKNITSEECKNKLALIKIKESDFIQSNQALIIQSVNEKKILNNDVKQILRCFNSECANLIMNISSKNIEVTRNKISKSFEALNRIFSTDGIQLTTGFLSLKLEAATLLYQYELKKEQEREQQKAIKEQMVEEEKVRREIEHEKQKIGKEETQFKNEIDKLMKYMQKSNDDVQNQLYVDKIKELEEKLKLLEKDKENVLNREQNTRAGFVYIISNIGSFGEDVYKIGMTRRLEPMDRVKELSDASVPFEFDVHAMIFSEDAPALETLLHQTFRERQVNKINSRKEFFKVSLNDIADLVKSNYNATVEFTMIAEAKQYRESLQLCQASA